MRKVRTSAGKASYRWNWEEFMYLVRVLRQPKDFKETLNLFIDLHTQKEISEIIRRVIIASYLIDGVTFSKISEKTGASSSTITKIHQKMMRQKTVLADKISDAGFFEKEKMKKNIRTEKEYDSIKRAVTKYDIFHLLPFN